MAKQRNARVLFIEGCGSDLAFLSERAIRSGTHIGRQRRLLRLQLCFQLSSVPACSDCADCAGTGLLQDVRRSTAPQRLKTSLAACVGNIRIVHHLSMTASDLLPDFSSHKFERTCS